MPRPIAPSPSRPGARPSWRSTRCGTSSKKVAQALDLEGARARHRPADRLGVRRPRSGHAGALARPAGALGRAPVLHRRLAAPRRGPAGGATLHRQEPDPARREQQCPATALVRPFRRRTCVVSRSVEMVGATMALFAFYHCNGGELTSALLTWIIHQVGIGAGEILPDQRVSWTV